MADEFMTVYSGTSGHHTSISILCSKTRVCSVMLPFSAVFSLHFCPGRLYRLGNYKYSLLFYESKILEDHVFHHLLSNISI